MSLPRAGGLLDDRPAALATLVLLILVAARIWLAASHSTAPQARRLFDGQADSAAFLLLVGEAGDTAAARKVAPLDADRRPPLPLRVAAWSSGGGNRAHAGELVRLLGYPSPPVMLTIDGAGHVVRAQAVAVDGPRAPGPR
jgi:hypothetical protein